MGGLLLEFFEMLLQVEATIGAVSIDFEPGFGTLSMEDVLAWESFDYLAYILNPTTFAKLRIADRALLRGLCHLHVCNKLSVFQA